MGTEGLFLPLSRFLSSLTLTLLHLTSPSTTLSLSLSLSLTISPLSHLNISLTFVLSLTHSSYFELSLTHLTRLYNSLSLPLSHFLSLTLSIFASLSFSHLRLYVIENFVEWEVDVVLFRTEWHERKGAIQRCADAPWVNFTNLLTQNTNVLAQGVWCNQFHQQHCTQLNQLTQLDFMLNFYALHSTP